MVRAKAEVASGDLIEVVLSLRKEVTEMARKNEEQDRKIAQQEKQISTLQQKSVQQENDELEMKKKIVELENNILTLKKKDAEQVNDVKELKKTAANREHSVTQLKNRTDKIEKDVEELKGNTGEQESETARPRELIHDQNDDNHTIRGLFFNVITMVYLSPVSVLTFHCDSTEHRLLEKTTTTTRNRSVTLSNRS